MLRKELVEISEKDLIKKFNKIKDVFRIPRKYKLPEHLILKFANQLEEQISSGEKNYSWRKESNWWEEVARYQSLSENFILQMDMLNKWDWSKKIGFDFHNIWYYIFRYQDLSEEFIFRFQDKVKHKMYFWNSISSNPYLKEEFIDKHIDNLNWRCLCENLTFTEQMFEKYSDRIHWKAIWEHQTLNEDFILKYQDKIKWVQLLKNKSLAKDFYERNKHLITTKLYARDLAKIIEFQDISEDTLLSFKKGKMVWDSVGANLDMSREFIIENYDKLKKGSLVHRNRKLSKEIKDEVRMIERLSGNTYI